MRGVGVVCGVGVACNNVKISPGLASFVLLTMQQPSRKDMLEMGRSTPKNGSSPSSHTINWEAADRRLIRNGKQLHNEPWPSLSLSGKHSVLCLGASRRCGRSLHIQLNFSPNRSFSRLPPYASSIHPFSIRRGTTPSNTEEVRQGRKCTVLPRQHRHLPTPTT